ncbi:MAG: hypothetical protein QW734_07110 [Candidatus Bathyarchaeia archaeon]
MVKFGPVKVDNVNLYKMVRNYFKRDEDEEKTFSTPSGIVSVRGWKVGNKLVLVVRRIEFDPKKREYVMTDEIEIDPELTELVEKLRKIKGLKEMV